MKKIFLVTILLFQLHLVFGQNTKELNKKGSTGLAGSQQTRQYIPPSSSANNKELKTQNNCYKGFEFTVINYGYSKLGNHYSWEIKVKNNYQTAVSLRYKLIV